MKEYTVIIYSCRKDLQEIFTYKADIFKYDDRLKLIL